MDYLSLKLSPEQLERYFKAIREGPGELWIFDAEEQIIKCRKRVNKILDYFKYPCIKRRRPLKLKKSIVKPLADVTEALNSYLSTASRLEEYSFNYETISIKSSEIIVDLHSPGRYERATDLLIKLEVLNAQINEEFKVIEKQMAEMMLAIENAEAAIQLMAN